MADFVFRCVEHGDINHDDREPPECFCGERMVRVLTVPAVVRADPAGRQYSRDRDAYARMRADGVQPNNIDGSARLEARANTTHELAMGQVMPLRKVREGVRRSEDVVGKTLEV